MQTATALEHPEHVAADRVIDFDVYQPMHDGLGFHESWKALQDSGLPDVLWTPQNGGHWLVIRGKLINQVLADYANFSSHTILVPKETAGVAYRVIPISLDPPEHRPFRNLLNDDLSPKRIRSIEDSIREIAVDLIEAFRAKGQCNFVIEFAEQLPIRVFMKMVNLPLSDVPKLKYLVDQFTRPDGKLTYAEVTQLFLDYLAPMINERRDKDGTDMITRMLHSKIGDRFMTDAEAANLCIQVLVGGLDTVINFLSFVMVFLARSPETRQVLEKAPDRIPSAINELLRRFPLITVGREITHDMDFEGVHLKQGEMIMLPTMLHGLDEQENADSMSVNFDRTSIRHSTFGSGPHTCPGAFLARSEVRIMLEEWLSRIPNFAIAPGCDVGYTGGIVAAVKPFSLAWDASTTRA